MCRQKILRSAKKSKNTGGGATSPKEENPGTPKSRKKKNGVAEKRLPPCTLQLQGIEESIQRELSSPKKEGLNPRGPAADPQ